MSLKGPHYFALSVREGLPISFDESPAPLDSDHFRAQVIEPEPWPTPAPSKEHFREKIGNANFCFKRTNGQVLTRSLRNQSEAKNE